jgi:hypothetical protein
MRKTMSTEGERPAGGPRRTRENPELRALVDELRRDGEGGDPLFPKTARGRGAGKEAGPQVAQAEVTPALQVAQAAQVQAAPKRSLRPWWMALGVLFVVAPLIGLGLAAALREPVVQVNLAPSPAMQPGVTATAVVSVIAPAGAADAGREVDEDGGVKEERATTATTAVVKAPAVRDAGAPDAAPATMAAPAATTAKPPDPGTDIW